MAEAQGGQGQAADRAPQPLSHALSGTAGKPLQRPVCGLDSQHQLPPPCVRGARAECAARGLVIGTPPSPPTTGRSREAGRPCSRSGHSDFPPASRAPCWLSPETRGVRCVWNRSLSDFASPVSRPYPAARLARAKQPVAEARATSVGKMDGAATPTPPPWTPFPSPRPPAARSASSGPDFVLFLPQPHPSDSCWCFRVGPHPAVLGASSWLCAQRSPQVAGSGDQAVRGIEHRSATPQSNATCCTAPWAHHDLID